jgi:sulfhydrogenase subunit delta
VSRAPRAAHLICIGACATAGGLQALRNLADVADFARGGLSAPGVPFDPGDLDARSASCVPVDYELHGCPIDKHQLLEVVLAFAAGRRPQIAQESVCMECKAGATSASWWPTASPASVPVTQAGCGALCPAYNRGCYGCFGVREQAQVAALAAAWHGAQGVTREQLARSLRTYNTAAEPLRSLRHSTRRAPAAGGVCRAGGADP